MPAAESCSTRFPPASLGLLHCWLRYLQRSPPPHTFCSADCICMWMYAGCTLSLWPWVSEIQVESLFLVLPQALHALVCLCEARFLKGFLRHCSTFSFRLPYAFVFHSTCWLSGSFSFYCLVQLQPQKGLGDGTLSGIIPLCNTEISLMALT